MNNTITFEELEKIIAQELVEGKHVVCRDGNVCGNSDVLFTQKGIGFHRVDRNDPLTNGTFELRKDGKLRYIEYNGGRKVTKGTYQIQRYAECIWIQVQTSTSDFPLGRLKVITPQRTKDIKA